MRKPGEFPALQRAGLICEKIPMHYQYLSELGQHYFGEEGTEGVRRGALDGLAGNVRNAIMTLNQAKAALTPPPATGSVKDKAAFFKDQADLTKQATLKKALLRIVGLAPRLANTPVSGNNWSRLLVSFASGSTIIDPLLTI